MLENEKKQKFEKLRVTFCKNLRANPNVKIVRMLGKIESVCGLVVNRVDKDAVYLKADDDSVFYTDGFVEPFSFGGVIVLSTDSEKVAKRLVSVVEDKKINLGDCDVTMNDNTFIVLHYTGLDDHFLNGKMYQI